MPQLPKEFAAASSQEDDHHNSDLDSEGLCARSETSPISAVTYSALTANSQPTIDSVETDIREPSTRGSESSFESVGMAIRQIGELKATVRRSISVTSRHRPSLTLGKQSLEAVTEDFEPSGDISQPTRLLGAAKDAAKNCATIVPNLFAKVGWVMVNQQLKMLDVSS